MLISNNKILNSIVFFVSIYMVDYFCFLKYPSNFGFHNKSMFFYIASGIAISMVWRMNQNISTSVHVFPALPRIRFFPPSAKHRNRIGFSNFVSSVFRDHSPPKAFLGTKLLSLAVTSFFSAANRAFNDVSVFCFHRNNYSKNIASSQGVYYVSH